MALSSSQAAAFVLASLLFVLVNCSIEEGFTGRASHWNSPSTGKTMSERFSAAVNWSRARYHHHYHRLHPQRRRRALTGSTYQASGSDQRGFMGLEITVGNPQVKLSKALLDTGSDLIWFRSSLECSSNSSSNSNSTFYNPRESRAYQPMVELDSCWSFLQYQPVQACNVISSTLPLQCHFYQNYGSGAVIGALGTDTLWLHRAGEMQKRLIPLKSVVLGAVTGGADIDGLDGIVGLGRGRSSLVSQLGNKLGDKRFSYCFVDADHAYSSSPVYFGKSAELRDEGDIQSTPFLVTADETFYFLDLMSVGVGNSSFPGSQMLIDSGTTLTMLHESLFVDVMGAYNELVKVELGDGSLVVDRLDYFCYNVTGLGEVKFPGMTLRFGGSASMEIDGQSIVVPVDDGLACATVLRVPSGDVSVLGNVFQQNFHMLYDVDAMELSFVKTQCHLLR